MTSKSIPPISLLRKLLRYEPDTGKLFWKERPLSMFKDGKQSATQNCAAWNGKHTGKEAFYSVTALGYNQGYIFGRNYLGHRVAWAIHYGAWPSEVDHIDHDRTNNKINNLREVTRQQNASNMSIRKDNKSGTTGVYFYNPTEKWAAAIKVDYKRKHIGYYNCITAAVIARKLAEIKYGFHANHGLPVTPARFDDG